jgi:hypothetical protein
MPWRYHEFKIQILNIHYLNRECLWIFMADERLPHERRPPIVARLGEQAAFGMPLAHALVAGFEVHGVFARKARSRVPAVALEEESELDVIVVRTLLMPTRDVTVTDGALAAGDANSLGCLA